INWSLPDELSRDPLFGAPDNDFSCRSESHPNPVVMLHGLSLSRHIFLSQLQHKLNNAGYCTYSFTYGAHRIPSWVGGVRAMRDTAVEIADFIREVKEKTGAAKVDLIGHSEGGVQAIYVPMTQPGIADIVDHNIALGPAIHGAQYYGVTDLFYAGGEATRRLASLALRVLGCPACDDMATGGNIFSDFKNAERIVQPGNKATIIVSTFDTLVAPEVSMIQEVGVRNLIVQDICPDDKVGHGGLATDQTVWDMIINELEETPD
ncbi:Alpha/Beta hydrolase protein, partial [Stachybotrys elegans]